MTRVSYNRLHKPKNSSNWYFRAKVPAELRDLYGKREEKKSLDTPDKREAAELAVPYSWAFDSKIKALRERLNIQSDDRKSLSQCDQRDIDQMVVRWFQEKMDKLGVGGMSGSLSQEEALHELRIDEDELIANDESIKSSLNNNAVHIAADNNLRLEERFQSGELKRKVRQPFRLPNEDLNSPQYERLTDLLRRGLLELTKQSIAELEGDFSGEVTDKLFKHLIEGERPPTPQPVLSTSGKPSITLEELKDRFFTHKGHDPKNRKNLYNVMWEIMRQQFGADKPIRDLTRDDFRSILDLVKHLPKRASSTFPDYTYKQASDAAKRDGLEMIAPGTADSYLSPLRTMMKFAVQEDLVDRNLTEGLTIKATPQDKKAKTRLNPFPKSGEHLLRLGGLHFELHWTDIS